jgi:hypothetical protein
MDLEGKDTQVMDNMNRRFWNWIKTTSVSNSLYEIGNVTLVTKFILMYWNIGP